MKRVVCTWLGGLLLAGVWVCQAWGAVPALYPDGAIGDQAGRRIQIRQPFQRIISLYGAHTENCFRLGLGRRLIGVSPNTRYPDEARRLPVFSYHDDAEKFLAARPDLVLVRPMIDRGYPQLMARLTRSGICVVSLQPATVDAMFTYWRILGRLGGQTRRAEAMVAAFQGAVQDLRALSAGVKAKKRVYFEAIHGKMKTFTPDSMAIFALEAAGGINLAADANASHGTNIANYGKERILALGARMDLYLAQVGAMNRPTLAMIRNEPGFQAIKAVREGQIHLVDEMVVARPTFRLLEGIVRIGERLYPERFQGAG